DRRPLLTALEVRPVAADAYDDVRPRDLDRINRPSVDLVEMLGDELVQPGIAVNALVEARQPRDPLLVAGGDAVEVVLHPGREVVVDETPVVLLEQAGDGEGEEGRDERGAALDDVAAVEDRRQDRGVRRRPADAAVLERLDERRLGVPRRRCRLVALRLELEQLDAVAGMEIRQTPV